MKETIARNMKAHGEVSDSEELALGTGEKAVIVLWPSGLGRVSTKVPGHQLSSKREDAEVP